MKKRMFTIIAALAACLLLAACGGTSDGTTGDTGTEPDSETVVAELPTTYTNENGITFQIVKAEDVWALAEKLTQLSGDEERPDEMYIQIDMIADGNYVAFHEANGLTFDNFVLKDLADGTPRRMEIMGTLLSSEKYADAAYASGATLDDTTRQALCDKWNTLESGDRVTVRGKLIRANFTNRFKLRNEYAQHYEVYMAVMELEPKEVGAVHLGDVRFDTIDDGNDLWVTCEMVEQYITALPGYPAEPCYVELTLQVAEDVAFEESETYAGMKFVSLEADDLPDGLPGRIDLMGRIYRHTEPLTRAYLGGATVDDDTYKALTKKCAKLKGGETVVVKGCLVSSYLTEPAEGTRFYDTKLAIIDMKVR